MEPKLEVVDAIVRNAEQVRGQPRKTRVYVDLAKETIIENLFNRRNRPVAAYRALLNDAATKLYNLGVSFTAAKWSQQAGCACGCSPGFVLDGDYGRNVFLTVRKYEPPADADDTGNPHSDLPLEVLPLRSEREAAENATKQRVGEFIDGWLAYCDNKPWSACTTPDELTGWQYAERLSGERSSAQRFADEWVSAECPRFAYDATARVQGYAGLVAVNS